MKHTTQPQVDLKKGIYYVLKNKISACASTTVSSVTITHEVVELWLRDSQSLYGWHQQFRLANNDNNNNRCISFNSLKEEEYKNNTAKAFKTPNRKRFDEDFGTPSAVKYTKLIDGDFTFLNEKSAKYAKQFDNTIESNIFIC